MPRLGFPKSRKGCLKCKQRRVKCDEKRPSCSACARHGLHCSLADATVAENGGASDQGASPAEGSPSTATKENPFPYLSSLVKNPEATSIESWTADLELMHHFTTTTWKTLPRSEHVGGIWQIELPKLAVPHSYLMHQLLAISATHMAWLYPDTHSAYLVRATQHQNNAIQLLQGALPSITADNCHVVFLTASLLSITEYAALSSAHNGQPGIDDLLRVFLLVRGMNEILQSYEDYISRSPIGVLLQIQSIQSRSHLLEQITNELESMRSALHMDPVKSTSLEEGLGSLLYWIGQSTSTSELPELRVMTAWPTGISDGFLNLLRRRDGDALKILDCFCRILEFLGPEYWYLQGWGFHVRKDIHSICSWD